MASLKFFYDNLWDDFTVIPSTEHANFLAINTQHRDFNEPWRSLYGAGSGWGTFEIVANINDRIDFDEGGGELNVNLTPGVYDVDTLCAHLKAIMEAAGAHTYTWEYLEAGAGINKFKVTDGTGTVAFPWQTGTNGSAGTARTVGLTIGFRSEDDAAAATHTADDIRIHYYEILAIDLGVATAIDGCIVRGHNFQSGATITLQWSTDNWASVAGSQVFTVQDDILIIEWDTSKTFRYWRIYIEDVDNPAGYVEVGRVFLGAHFQPTKHFAYNRTITQGDPSLIKESEDGQVTSIQRSHFQAWQYQFLGTNQKSSFDAMFDNRGFSKSLFICEDPDTPLTTTFCVMFRGWSWKHLFDSYWSLSLTTREER